MAERSIEERIREKAYELWVSEGHPHGRDEAHWEAAREMVATEDSQRATLLPRTAGVGEPVEPAEAFENQGEFPSLTDQGNAEPGPSRKATRRTSRSATNQGESVATSLPLGEAGGEKKTKRGGGAKAPKVAKAGKSKTDEAATGDAMPAGRGRGRAPKAAKEPASDIRH